MLLANSSQSEGIIGKNIQRDSVGECPGDGGIEVHVVGTVVVDGRDVAAVVAVADRRIKEETSSQLVMSAGKCGIKSAEVVVVAVILPIEVGAGKEGVIEVPCEFQTGARNSVLSWGDEAVFIPGVYRQLPDVLLVVEPQLEFGMIGIVGHAVPGSERKFFIVGLRHVEGVAAVPGVDAFAFVLATPTGAEVKGEVARLNWTVDEEAVPAERQVQ